MIRYILTPAPMGLRPKPRKGACSLDPRNAGAFLLCVMAGIVAFEGVAVVAERSWGGFLFWCGGWRGLIWTGI